jgi:ribosome-binding factor A
MSKRKQRRKPSPPEFEPSTGRTDRKAQRLCGQIARALNLALATCRDEALRDVVVDTVVPAPDTAHVRVLVSLLAPREPGAAREILEHLRRAVPYFRAEIATAIRRRKVPQLAFSLAAPDVSEERGS